MTHLLVVLWALAIDGGVPSPAAKNNAKTVKPEDAELVENLELLENLDQSKDFELLQELSVDR